MRRVAGYVLQALTAKSGERVLYPVLYKSGTADLIRLLQFSVRDIFLWYGESI